MNSRPLEALALVSGGSHPGSSEPPAGPTKSDHGDAASAPAWGGDGVHSTAFADGTAGVAAAASWASEPLSRAGDAATGEAKHGEEGSAAAGPAPGCSCS